MDEYWKSALNASLDMIPYVETIYSPYEFFPFSRKFYPFEFSDVLPEGNVGFCIEKTLLHRLNPKLLDLINQPKQVIFSNDVFFVVCLNPPDEINWIYYRKDRFREFMDMRAATLNGSIGKNNTHYWRIDKGEGFGRVLVVGATNMGNTGDDLTALSIGSHLRSVFSDCSIYYTDYRITQPDVADFDLIILGGGGIIYSSQTGYNELQNLSNYLKLTIWASKQSIPCLIFGVGVQGKPGHLHEDPVVKKYLGYSLNSATDIIVRDKQSVAELQPTTNNEIKLLPDLVFSYGVQLPYYRDVYDRADSKCFAFIGELFSIKINFFNQILQNEAEDFFEVIGKIELCYIIMSNDDLGHKDRFVDLVTKKGYECKIYDLRKASISEALDIFRSLSGIVTTRFHGLVLSIISGCPAISIDVSWQTFFTN